MCGAEAIRDAVHDHSIILAAHGPYTAAGAGAMFSALFRTSLLLLAL